MKPSVFRQQTTCIFGNRKVYSRNSGKVSGQSNTREHLAACFGLTSEIQYLILRRDIDSCDVQRQASISANQAYEHVVRRLRRLLGNGANLDTKDVDGRTPLL